MAKTNKGWCYSFNNVDFKSGTFETQNLAIEDAQREGVHRNSEGENNQFIYVAHAELTVNSSLFPDADNNY